MKRQLVISLFTFLLFPLLALAVEGSETKTFATIPFLSGNNFTTQGFVTALYQMAIGLAAVLVVIRLIMAGAKYMLSEVVSSKGDAKEDIKSALLGLLIILSAVLILGTINPKLVGLNVLNNGNPVELTNPNTNNPPTSDENPSGDNIDFKPGDTKTRDFLIGLCKNTGDVSKSQACLEKNETKLEQSCVNDNKGSFRKESDDLEGTGPTQRYYCDPKT